MLDKKFVINNLNNDHRELKEFLLSLSKFQLTEEKIIDLWTTKDVIAHLAAWNWEVIDETGRILADQASWPKKYESEEQENEFNKIQVAKRKEKFIDEILKEWENSQEKLIEKIGNLTEEQWNHQSGSQTWTLGRLKDQPVTVFSLFDYEYKGQSHEGGHMEQIRKHFNK